MNRQQVLPAGLEMTRHTEITLAPLQHLDGKHTIFGRIKSGMKVIQKMSMVQTDSNDKPLDDVKIFKATKS